MLCTSLEKKRTIIILLRRGSTLGTTDNTALLHTKYPSSFNQSSLFALIKQLPSHLHLRVKSHFVSFHLMSFKTQQKETEHNSTNPLFCLFLFNFKIYKRD